VKGERGEREEDRGGVLAGRRGRDAGGHRDAEPERVRAGDAGAVPGAVPVRVNLDGNLNAGLGPREERDLEGREKRRVDAGETRRRVKSEG
jgi:hypothetical protein